MTTSVNAAEYLEAEIAEHTAVAARTRESMAAEFPRLVAACAQALRSGHKLLLFGTAVPPPRLSTSPPSSLSGTTARAGSGGRWRPSP